MITLITASLGKCINCLTLRNGNYSGASRLVRGAEDHQSPGLRGLYPAGEGAGYAGGIVSSAVDGLRVAEVICMELGPA